jgi:predicted nucleic acid-binding protein
MERWQLSLWDSLILAAARRAAVTTIYSEDLSDEQDYEGIRILNPFREG